MSRANLPRTDSGRRGPWRLASTVLVGATICYFSIRIAGRVAHIGRHGAALSIAAALLAAAIQFCVAYPLLWRFARPAMGGTRAAKLRAVITGSLLVLALSLAGSWLVFHFLIER